MNGHPVWLASVSLRDQGGIIATRRWSRSQHKHAESALFEALGGHQIGTCLGEPTVQRCFRMNVTLCIHRKLTAHEVAVYTKAIRTPNLAGAPIEILWEEGCQTSASCLPCEHPRQNIIDPSRFDLWLPVDCGTCPPCLARAQIVKEEQDAP